MASFTFLCLLCFGMFDDLTYEIELKLYRTNEQGVREVITNPKMITRNFQTGSLKVGQTVPVLANRMLKNGKYHYMLEHAQTGLQVKLTPVLMLPGVIHVKIDGSYSELDQTLPHVLNQTVFTTTQTTPLMKTKSTTLMPADINTKTSLVMDITVVTVRGVGSVGSSIPNSP